MDAKGVVHGEGVRESGDSSSCKQVGSVIGDADREGFAGFGDADGGRAGASSGELALQLGRAAMSGFEVVVLFFVISTC